MNLKALRGVLLTHTWLFSFYFMMTDRSADKGTNHKESSEFKKDLDRIFTIPETIAFHLTPAKTGEYTGELAELDPEDVTVDWFDPVYDVGKSLWSGVVDTWKHVSGATKRENEKESVAREMLDNDLALAKKYNEKKKKRREARKKKEAEKEAKNNGVTNIEAPAGGEDAGGEIDPSGDASSRNKIEGRKIHEFYQLSKENDKARDGQALYIKDNGADDDVIDAAGYDMSSLDPQLKLQNYFRKAFEYRMVNAMEATELKTYSDILTALTLILSSVVSVLLLAGESSDTVRGAAILSTLIGLITGYLSYMGFNERLERHNQSVAAFAAVQRQIYNVLMVEDDKGIFNHLVPLTSSFNEARQGMSLIPTHKIAQYRDNQDRSLFPSITDDSLWNESLEVRILASLSDFSLYFNHRMA
jgi:hypothetical protein